MRIFNQNIDYANCAVPYLKTTAYSCWEKISNFFKCCIVFAKSICNLSEYSIKAIDIDQLSPEFKEKLKKFEASFCYPFSSTEQFRIEHGKAGDYFAFFRGLGKPYYWVATTKSNPQAIAAVGAAVLRTLKSVSGTPLKAWYLCDLKVSEQFQGQHLPLMLFSKGVWRYVQCPRGFGICMNPATGEPKAAKIWKAHAPLGGTTVKVLNLYTITTEQVREHRQKITELFIKYGYMEPLDSISFTTTTGRKDYQIFNNEQERSWKLAHIQHGSNGVAEPLEAHVHMLSAVNETSLDKELAALLGAPSSTAQIVSLGMDNFDFNHLTTDQI